MKGDQNTGREDVRKVNLMEIGSYYESAANQLLEHTSNILLSQIHLLVISSSVLCRSLHFPVLTSLYINVFYFLYCHTEVIWQNFYSLLPLSFEITLASPKANLGNVYSKCASLQQICCCALWIFNSCTAFRSRSNNCEAFMVFYYLFILCSFI